MANMPGRCSLRLPATSRQPGANPRRSAQRAPATAAVAARQLTDGSRRLSPMHGRRRVAAVRMLQSGARWKMIDWRDVMAEGTCYAIVNEFSIVGRIP
jgi:streptomycin 6-kinase